MMSTPGIFVFITSIFKYYYFTSTRLACILVMRVESDSFWYTVKIDDKGQVRVIGGKLLPYELNHSPTDACQSLQLPH